MHLLIFVKIIDPLSKETYLPQVAVSAFKTMLGVEVFYQNQFSEVLI